MGHHQGANPMRLNQRDGVSKEGEKGLGPHLALTLGLPVLSTRGGSRLRSVDWKPQLPTEIEDPNRKKTRYQQKS